MSKITPGIYVIQTPDLTKGLGIGPIPLIYPPPTVKLRVLSGFMVDKWRLVVKDSGFAITDRNPEGGYTITQQDGFAYVQWTLEGFPKAWAIESAGNDEYVIKEINEDRVFTRVEGQGAWGGEVALKPANGTPEQKWKFQRLGDD